jgi:hypothetical protein
MCVPVDLCMCVCCCVCVYLYMGMEYTGTLQTCVLCVPAYACMHACMLCFAIFCTECMYVYMYVCMYRSFYAEPMYVYMYVYICMYACLTFTRSIADNSQYTHTNQVSEYMYAYVCIYVRKCMYVLRSLEAQLRFAGYPHQSGVQIQSKQNSLAT